MRWFWVSLIGLVLLSVEVGSLANLRPFGGGPDLVLLFVIFLSLYGPADDAPISGWLLGLAKDCLSSGTFGLHAVIFMAVAFLLSRVRADIFLEYAKAHVVNAGSATLVVYLAAGLWRWFDGAAAAGTPGFVIGVTLWNALLAPAAFRVFFKFSRRLEAVRRRSS